jgi:hypothetical protein
MPHCIFANEKIAHLWKKFKVSVGGYRVKGLKPVKTELKILLIWLLWAVGVGGCRSLVTLIARHKVI